MAISVSTETLFLFSGRIILAVEERDFVNRDIKNISSIRNMNIAAVDSQFLTFKN